MEKRICVKSEILHRMKAHELNVGSDVYPELETVVEKLLLAAAARAKANGRRTLLGRDL